jgi:putative glycosyltransferase
MLFAKKLYISFRMKLSIVTTLYCSTKHISEFYTRIVAQVDELSEVADSYEIVFVDDGSPDDSLQKVIELSEQDSHVKVIELSKNHGHHRAMMIGLEHSSGEKVFLIDCDLEEPPENLGIFWRELSQLPSVDLVYGEQLEKEGSGLKKYFSMWFYKVFNSLSNVEIPDNELVTRLMNRNVVDAMLRYRESELFLPGVWADVGFRRQAIPTNKAFNGESSYTISKRAAMAVDAITSFSTKPLLYVFYFGFVMSLLSFVFALYLVGNKLFLGTPVNGWTSILVSLYLIGGMIIFCVGAVGLYLSRVFSEVKQRPLSLVRKIHSKGK